MSLSFVRRRLIAAGGLVLTLFIAACSDGRKPVFPVQGRILDADGNPAAGAKVIFHPLNDNEPDAARPIGIVDEAGAYSLTTYEKGDGAPPGDYAVTVEWRPAKPAPFGRTSEDKLKGRYAVASKSPFKATVNRQPTTLDAFRLD
jgi:hypothetical protein